MKIDKEELHIYAIRTTSNQST